MSLLCAINNLPMVSSIKTDIYKPQFVSLFPVTVVSHRTVDITDIYDNNHLFDFLEIMTNKPENFKLINVRINECIYKIYHGFCDDKYEEEGPLFTIGAPDNTFYDITSTGTCITDSVHDHSLKDISIIYKWYIYETKNRKCFIDSIWR